MSWPGAFESARSAGTARGMAAYGRDPRPCRIAPVVPGRGVMTRRCQAAVYPSGAYAACISAVRP